MNDQPSPTAAQRFRKKPVEIEAVRWTGENGREIQAWSNGVVRAGRLWLTIPTLEGEMRADIGDWLIRGVKGEFYPCKPDIFEATYDPVAVSAERAQMLADIDAADEDD